MWVISGIIATAAYIVWIEVPPLRKAKAKRELWLFSILLLLGTGLCLAFYFQLAIPNPLDMIYVVFRPMSEVLISILK